MYEMKSFAALPFPDVLVIVNINLHPLVCCQFWIKPKRCFRCLSSVRCHKGSSLNNNFIVRNAIYCCFQRYLLAVRTFYILDLGGSLANCDLIITPPVPLEVGAILASGSWPWVGSFRSLEYLRSILRWTMREYKLRTGLFVV